VAGLSSTGAGRSLIANRKKEQAARSVRRASKAGLKVEVTLDFWHTGLTPHDSMKLPVAVIVAAIACLEAAAQVEITSFSRDGLLVVSNAFTNGVCTIEQAADVSGPWVPSKNVFTTGVLAHVSMSVTGSIGFHRALAVDLSNGREGFTNFV